MVVVDAVAVEDEDSGVGWGGAVVWWVQVGKGVRERGKGKEEEIGR